MAARKKQSTRNNTDSLARPASTAPLPPAGTAPSPLQKCLLAGAVLLEVSWVAALVTMALDK